MISTEFVFVSEAKGVEPFKSDSTFLFSLNNVDGLLPFQMKIKPNQVLNNANEHIEFGTDSRPDLVLKFDMTGSSENLGLAYKLPAGYSYGSDNARTLLAGTTEFVLDDIEVFYSEGIETLTHNPN